LARVCHGLRTRLPPRRQDFPSNKLYLPGSENVQQQMHFGLDVCLNTALLCNVSGIGLTTGAQVANRTVANLPYKNELKKDAVLGESACPICVQRRSQGAIIHLVELIA
jgi:hypothetical protein